MDSLFRGKNILITGGTGAFGTKFVQYLKSCAPNKVLVFSRDEMKHAAMKRTFSGSNALSCLKYQIGDICRKDDLETAMLDADIVVHAAAMKHLPECECHPLASNLTNVSGTQNVVSIFNKSKADTLIFLSTDKAPYASSIYGAQKYIGEKLITHCSSENPQKKAFSLRYSNVIDSTGAVFNIFGNMLSAGKKVTVNGTSTIRGFVTQSTVISCIETAMKYAQGGETIVLRPKIIRIAELASTMHSLLGKGEVEILETTSFQGEKDSATLIMEEELAITKDFPEAETQSYILDHTNKHPQRKKITFGHEGSLTLENCEILSGTALKEFLIPVMKSNNLY